VCFLSYCLPGYSLLCFFMPRSCSCDLWSRLTAEGPNQPFQVLHCGRQVELLAYEAHPAQSQSAQSDVILQFCEECFHFPPSPLRDRERWCLGEGECPLPRRLAGVDGQGPILASRAAVSSVILAVECLKSSCTTFTSSPLALRTCDVCHDIFLLIPTFRAQGWM
jgi:hypothetical protein